jgi:hypothetical protein
MTQTIREQRIAACKFYTTHLQQKFGFETQSPAFRATLEDYLVKLQAYMVHRERGGIAWKAPIKLEYEPQRLYYEVVPAEGPISHA